MVTILNVFVMSLQEIKADVNMQKASESALVHQFIPFQ